MKNKLTKFISRFFLINDTPQKIAGGAALGIFLGIFPGEGVLATLFFATIFRFNKLSATAGVLAVNMWATALVLPLAAAIGCLFFGIEYDYLIGQFNANYQAGFKNFLVGTIFFDIAVPLLVGFFVVSGLIASGFYFLLYFILKRKHIEHLKDKINLRKK
jgi:uncharacterized protein (DUF2062 family)